MLGQWVGFTSGSESDPVVVTGGVILTPAVEYGVFEVFLEMSFTHGITCLAGGVASTVKC